MTTGICYGCRHADDPQFSTSGHCRGNGDLEPSPEARWEGFTCTCPCREETNAAPTE